MTRASLPAHNCMAAPPEIFQILSPVPAEAMYSK